MVSGGPVRDAFLSDPAALEHRFRQHFSHIATDPTGVSVPYRIVSNTTPGTGVTTARIGRVMTLMSARTNQRPGTVKCYVLNVQRAMAAATASTPSR
jgi:hypothetical protein